MLKEYLEESGEMKKVLIPAGDLFYFVSPDTISEFIKSNTTGRLIRELEAFDTIPNDVKKSVSYEMGMLEITWREKKEDPCKNWIQTFPDPIPNIYQIPVPVVENLISAETYKMQIKQEGGQLVLRKNIAGVYKADNYDNPNYFIEQIIAEKTGSRVEFMRMYQNKMTFKILGAAM